MENNEKYLLDSLTEQAAGLVEIATGLSDRLETLPPSELVLFSEVLTVISKGLTAMVKIHQGTLALYVGLEANTDGK